MKTNLLSLATFWVLSALCSARQLAVQRFIEEPRSVSVREGETVVLSCSVDNKRGVLQWTKDDFGLGTSRDLSQYSRYRMTGEQGRQWNLEIVNVSLEDDGKYQCQVGATETADPIRSRYSLVRVVAPPQPPVLTAGPELVLRQGKTALVQCISKGGKPASVIRWSRNGELINSGVLEKVEKLNGTSEFITVSTLTFPVFANQTGDTLECEASHEAEDVARTVSTEIKVEFAPVVSLRANTETIYEGDSVKLTCSAQANPGLVEYHWTLGGEELTEGRGAREVLLLLDRNFNNKKVACFARNAIGENMASYSLDVKYSPVFKVTPQDVIGNLHDKVNLECSVDSNPPASYQWLFEERFKLTGPLLNMELTNLTAGSYTCQASVPGFPSVSHTSRVKLRGPPRIIVRQGTQFSSAGETVHVICEAESLPAAKSFSWTFNGSPLESDQPTHSIIETQHGTSVRSTLIINQVQPHHFGDFGCTVENDLGTSDSSITLVEKESMPLLIIISASIAGFLLTIVAIVIVVTCKKVAKTKSDNSSWSPSSRLQIQPDRLSNSSNDSNIHSSNTTSSLSTVDDLEGCSDIIQEFRGSGQYLKSPLSERSNPRNYNTGSELSQFTSEHDLLEHAARYSSDYHNPYLQTVTPTSDFSSGHLSPSYRNVGAGGRDEGRYLSGRENALLSRLRQGHLGDLNSEREERNQTSIGTHV